MTQLRTASKRASSRAASRATIRSTRNTGGKSQLLEQCVDALHMIGFQVYESYPSFNAATVVPGRYVTKGYPHDSLYGTHGRKEALIHADGAEWVVEAKWQEVGGSVDEKLPYIYQSFLASPVQHWIAVLDGHYWKSGRGKLAFEWLLNKGKLRDLTHRDVPGSQLRRFVVVDRRGFIEFAKQTWGQS